jgi:hypothetical protein
MMFACIYVCNAQLALANPTTVVAQKLQAAGLLSKLGPDWLFLTAADAVDHCTPRLRVHAL